MSMNDNILRILDAWPCCSLATVPIVQLAKREREFFTSFMPEAVTSIVLAHHVVTEEEWAWYATIDEGQRCDADDHLRYVCEGIRKEVVKQGYDTELVKYPEESGLQFRFVAEAAGLGLIGTNAFLFHPTWGPWVHLRVMATGADIDIRPQLSGEELCNQCGLCISECPAGAISEANFEGLQCRSFRKARGEYEPYGYSREYRYCKTCALICPQGEQPLPRGGGVE